MDYPISVPSVGLVGGKFVDEDTASGTVGSLIPSAWGNAVTDELLGVIKAAGLVPSETDLNQLVKAIRGLTSSPVGSVRNGRMNIAAQSASGTFTADEVIVSTALGGQSYRLANFAKTINLAAAVGAGGMDAGTAPVTGFVAIYAIYNPTTKVSALLATNATAAKVGEIYGGGNMPAGYTASALLTVVPTGSTSQFLALTVRDREVHVASLYVYTTNALVTLLAVTATTAPLNAVSLSGTVEAGCTAASQVGTLLSDGDVPGSGLQSIIANVVAGGNAVCPFRDLMLSASKQFTVTTSISGSGTATYRVAASGYKI